MVKVGTWARCSSFHLKRLSLTHSDATRGVRVEEEKLTISNFQEHNLLSATEVETKLEGAMHAAIPLDTKSPLSLDFATKEERDRESKRRGHPHIPTPYTQCSASEQPTSQQLSPKWHFLLIRPHGETAQAVHPEVRGNHQGSHAAASQHRCM
jgi:hypothetical protein